MDEIQGKDGEWVPATTLLGCCDCGLVHQMQYRLEFEDGSPVPNANRIKLMVSSIRDRELTQKAREEKNFVCSIKSNGGKNGSI